MAKPTRQEPIVLQSTWGEHARALRELVLEIADVDTGDCNEGYTYSASIKYFTGHVTQHYFVSVMETMYYWLWWNQFTIVIFHLDICKEFTTNGGTLNSTLVSSNYRYYSFKIFFRFWLAKSTRLIHHNQLLMTKFGRILCLTRKWRPKCSVFAGQGTVNREDLGTRLSCFDYELKKWRTFRSFQE